MELKQKLDDSTDEKSGCIPTRYFMAFLVFGCGFLTYLARTDINLTIVTMVNQTDSNADNDTMDVSDRCPSVDDDAIIYQANTTDKNSKAMTFQWDSDTQSLLISSFYFGYVCTQVLGGFLSERLGPKWLIGCATLAGAILTLLSPLAASWNVTALIGLRVLLGFTQGAIYPSSVTFVNTWSHSKERSTVTVAALSGGTVGTIFAMEIGGFLCKYGFAGGWPSVYYVFGSMSVIWFILWSLFAHNSPENHPTISEKEKLHLRNHAVPSAKQPFPWKSIFTSLPVLACVVAHSSSAWTSCVLLSELPTYLNYVLHLSIEQNGTINAIMYVVGLLVSVLLARVADWFISSGRSKRTFTRKLMQNFGHYGSAACFLIIPLVGCNSSLVIMLLIIAKGFASVAVVSDYSIVSDMAHSHAGTIYGIANTMASLMGLLAPTVTGVFIKHGMGRLSQWRWIFSITAAIEVFGAIFFLIFSDAEEPPWATPSEDQEHCINNQSRKDTKESLQNSA